MADDTEVNDSLDNTSYLPKWLVIFLILIAAVTIFILFLYFNQFNGTWGSQEIFAQFGDFIGGTINPTLGFATVVLLIWSIQVQLRELRETRIEASQSRIAYEGQLEIAMNETRLKQIQMAIDTYIIEREQLLLTKIPEECLAEIDDLLTNYYNLNHSERALLIKNISNLNYKGYIVPFASVFIPSEILGKVERHVLDHCILSMLVKNSKARQVIFSGLFMTLQISKSLFDYHHITTYKKHPTALLWKHQLSYLEPFKDFIDVNGFDGELLAANEAGIPSLYEELKVQIEKVNNLIVDF